MITKLYLPTLDRLRELEAAHLVSVRDLGDLIICNYTQRCAYRNAWDADTMACRGLILRVDKPWPLSTEILEVVALPFAKFFNVGESERWPGGDLVEVTEKMDGSLGILYRLNGQCRIATRGSFHSDQAFWATTYLQAHHDLSDLPDNLTLLFEIIYPEGRVVVDYGERKELVLLAVIDRETGEDWEHWRVALLGDNLGLPYVQTHFGFSAIEHAVTAAETQDLSLEGWVLRFSDGQRWKVKGLAYRHLHHFLNHFSRKRVIEWVLEDVFDFRVTGVPPSYLAEAQAMRDDIERQVSEKTARIEDLFAQAPQGDRKEYALWVTGQYKAESDLLFRRLDGKEIRTLLLKRQMETASNVTPLTGKEDSFL